MSKYATAFALLLIATGMLALLAAVSILLQLGCGVKLRGRY